ncbi:MAG: hypothetical protein BWX84_03060 [Verrucomicrobia bacterium ADurb.Bin118]|nr:MAG: hypothetical protein BWX84_03060 [Verrucomicrobia bacterium ADurb.Bin118]
MTERYDSTSARHYAAFRPPLHRAILDRVIGPHEFFPVGLDVGCGTGYSAVALAKYCDRVFGLDPSQSMLEAAQRHPRVTYVQGSGCTLGRIGMSQFDIVTFAGSLFYAKAARLRRELARVCPPGSTIVVYDFEILLNDVMAELGAASPAVASDYDHCVNLSDWAECAVVDGGAERLRLKVTGSEMAHLLLADSFRYDALVRRFPHGDPFASLVDCLEHFRANRHLEADIYFTRYRMVGS